MLELRFIRENIAFVREKCLRRGMDTELIDTFTATDARRLTLLAEAAEQIE